MKINFLLPHVKVAGGTRIVLKYADLLLARGYDVKIIVPAFSKLRRIVYNLFNFTPRSFQNFNSNIIWVDNLDQKNIPNADVIVASPWPTAKAVATYDRKKGKKFWLVQHYESLYHGVKEVVDPVYKLPLKKIVVSGWLCGIMKNKFSEESFILSNPIDTKQFKFIPDLRKSGVIRILMLHHSKEWKGVKKGMEIVKKIKKEYPNIELIMFGAGEKDKDVQCDEYLRNPNQEDLAGIYSSCGIFLCPAEWEGYGLTGLEAMACKCLLVTFDTGGSRDYAFDMRTAFVAEHGNLNELYSKLKLAVTDKNLREKIALNGFNYVVKNDNFKWGVAVDKLEKIIQN